VICHSVRFPNLRLMRSQVGVSTQIYAGPISLPAYPVDYSKWYTTIYIHLASGLQMRRPWRNSKSSPRARRWRTLPMGEPDQVDPGARWPGGGTIRYPRCLREEESPRRPGGSLWDCVFGGWLIWWLHACGALANQCTTGYVSHQNTHSLAC